MPSDSDDDSISFSDFGAYVNFWDQEVDDDVLLSDFLVRTLRKC